MSVTSTVNTTDVELKMETFQFRSVHFSLDQFRLDQFTSDKFISVQIGSVQTRGKCFAGWHESSYG